MLDRAESPADAIQVHECLDGPFGGFMVTWPIGGEIPPAWCELAEGDDAGLHHVQDPAGDH